MSYKKYAIKKPIKTYQINRFKYKTMNTKLLICIAVIFSGLQGIGQEKASRFDLRLGTGISLMGTGDLITFNYENELNLKLNKFITSSFSINLGRSNYGVSETASFVQGNVNLFFSPFNNKRRFDFRVGTGLTYFTISQVYLSSKYWENGVLIDIDYQFINRNSLGFNIIMENSYLLTDKFLAGLKLFIQPYFNGDINSGIMLKCGFKL